MIILCAFTHKDGPRTRHGLCFNIMLHFSCGLFMKSAKFAMISNGYKTYA